MRETVVNMEDRALERVSSEVQLGTLQASTPQSLVNGASEMARVLDSVIEEKKLFTLISGKKHVRVEGWLRLATMLECTPREVSAARLAQDGEFPGAWESSVEIVRMKDGAVISRASAMVSDDEPMWKSRSHYARRSSATTRTTSKACRLAFSWIMSLSGYATTPTEEMPQGTAPQNNQASPGLGDGSNCPIFQASMAIKNGSNGKFWGCVNYREKGCKGTRPCNVVDAEQEQHNTFDHVTSDED